MYSSSVKPSRVVLAVLLTLPLWFASKPAISQKLPEFKIERPTIIAFYSPNKLAKEDAPDENEVRADFQLYTGQAKPPLQKMGVALLDTAARTFRIRNGDQTTTFRASSNVGYYFIAPGKEPRIEYEVMTDVDLVQAAREYFQLKFKEP